MIAAAVAVACLLSAGAGGCIGALWADSIERRAKQAERHRLEMARRSATISADLALTRGITYEQAQAAIARAMQ